MTSNRYCLLWPLLAVVVLSACKQPEAGLMNGAAHPAAAKIEGERIVLGTEGALPPGIQVEPARAGGAHAVRLPGRLVWDEDRTVRIFSPFGGRVARILAQPGMEVAQGQPLAAVASPDFGTAQAESRKANTDLALAGKDLERQRELYQNGVTAHKELQTAEADYARAQAESERAGARLKLYGPAANSVDQRYLLKSPLAGVVVERMINPGQELRPDQSDNPLFVVTDPGSLWVEINANASDLHELAPGNTFSIDAGQDHEDKLAGIIVQVSDFVDPVTRTVKIRGQVPNAGRRLKAGMYITAEIQMPPGPQPVVPAKAVFLQGDNHFVFVKDGNGAFARRPVTIGGEEQGLVRVLAGLSANEPVVVEGALYLQQILESARKG